MDEKNNKISGDAEIKIPVSEKLENFWYHYKWHTIAGAFAVIVFVILTFQFCTKTDYDVHIIYAGEKNISSSSYAGDGNSEYFGIIKSLMSAAYPERDSKDVNINLQNLYILSQKEYEESTASMKDPMQKASLESSIRENRDLLYNSMMYDEYFLCLLSEDIFLEYEEKLDTSIFAPIVSYTTDGIEYEYAGERGIYLSSLPIYSDPAMSILPPDTVVCIRLPGLLGTRDNGKMYKKAEDVLRAILSYEK